MQKRKSVPPISIPEEAFEAFAKLAKEEGKSMSQAIRDAMQEYAAKRAVEADFNVGAWGGVRTDASAEVD